MFLHGYPAKFLLLFLPAALSRPAAHNSDSTILFHQNLSEEFIREFHDEVGWYAISMHQILSEDLIREFQDKVIWDAISAYQKLSEKFVIEFKDKIFLNNVLENEKISKSLKKKIRENKL